MNRLTEGIKAFLYDSRKKGARSAAAAILAAAVMLSVVAGLVRPAVSMTGSVEYTEITGPVYNAYPADMPANANNALEIGHANNSTLTGVYDIEATIGKIERDPVMDVDKYYTELLMSFNLTPETVAQIRANNGDSIKFSLEAKDPDTQAVSDVIRMYEGMKLSDVVVSGGSKQQIGRYYIDPEAKEVTIQFDFESEYLKSKTGSSIDGGFNLKTWVWDEQNRTEDKTFEIAGTDVTVPIYRRTHQPDLNVTKTYNNDFFEGTEGDTMQGRHSLGSSFNIDITSNNGINETVIDITDTMVSDYVHIDLSKGSTVKLYDQEGDEITTEYPKVVISDVTSEGSTSKLTAKLIACPEGKTSDLFKEGFAYRFQCPVAVNDEYIGEDGQVKVTSEFYEIRGRNTVDVKTQSLKKQSSSDQIHVNLRADIAKDNGTYNPEDNTITWTYGIFKNNGWWIDNQINVDDLIGGPGGTIPDIVEESIRLEVATSTGKESEDDDREHLIYEAPDGSAEGNGVTGISYDAEKGRFTINMLRDPVQYDGKYYNLVPVKAFRVTYKTRVTNDDYGSTITNWVGMRDPEEPEDSENKYNWTDPGTAPVAKPGLSKDGDLDTDGITWSIKVTNSDGQDLTGLKVSDLMQGTAKQFDLSKATVNGGAVADVFTVSDDGTQLTFKEGQNAAEYVISYKQEMTEAEIEAARGGSFSNTATLKDPEDDPLQEVTKTVEIPRQYELTKEGTLTPQGEMIYTVTFLNQYGMQLNGQTIDDTLTLIGSGGAEVSADDYELTLISPASGVSVTPSASGNKLTTAITVTEDTTAKRIEVKYKVVPKSGSFMNKTGMQLNNTARWRGQPNTEASNNKTIEKFTKIDSKDGTYDQRSNKITWTVTISNPYGVDLGTFPTADAPYKLYDTRFGDGQILDFKVLDASGADVSGAGDLAAVNGSARENVDGTECGSYTFHSGMTSSSYRIVYVTRCSDDAETIEESNTAIYDSEPREKTVKINSWERTFNKVSKYSTGAGEISSDGNVVISWTAEVIGSAGSFLTKTLTDTMDKSWTFADQETAEDKDMSSVDHYMTEEQFDLNSFMITAYTASLDQWGNQSWSQLSDVPDYNALFELVRTAGTAEKVRGFELRPKTFPEGSDEYNALAAVERLTVEYSTTGTGADTLRTTLTDNDVLNYTNTAKTPSTQPSTGTKQYKKQPAITKMLYAPGRYGTNYNTSANINSEIGLTEFDQNNSNFISWRALDNNYYYLQYQLIVNKFENFSASDDITVVDTLPEGTEFYNEKELSVIKIVQGGQYKPIPDAASPTAPSYSLDTAAGTLTFNIPAAVHNGKEVDIEYCLRIPKASFSEMMNATRGRVELNNRAETGGEFDNIGVTISDDVDLVTKSGAEKDRNAVTYTLEINKNRRKLLSDNVSELVVRDTINLSDDGKHALSPIEFNQLSCEGNSIKVYKIDINGTETLLNIGDLGFEAPVKQTLPVQDGIHGYGDVYTFEVNVPDETYIRIVYDYSFSFNKEAKGDSTYDCEGMKLKNKAVIDGKNASSINDQNYSFQREDVSSAFANAMPDIKIRKSSKDSWANVLKGAQFSLRRYNSDTHQWEYFTEFDDVESIWEWNDDHNKDRGLGKARFGKWSADGTPLLLETGSDGKVTLPNLQRYYTREVTVGSETETRTYYDPDIADGDQQPYFYVLTEVKAPTGYCYAEGENEYYFFEQPEDASYEASYPKTAIQDAVSRSLIKDGAKINVVRADELIELTNNKIRLDVQKTWSGDAAGTAHAPIEVMLYESSTPPTNTATAYKVKLTLNRRWTSDPPRYYEYWINAGDTFEMDFRSTQFTNLELGSGLTSTMLGSDHYLIKSADPITESVEFVLGAQYEPGGMEAELLSQAGANTDPLFDSSQAEEVETVTLSEENGWHYEFDTENFDSSKYYFIKEYAPDGYIANYIVNGVHYGTLELENVKTEIDVQKYWNDKPGTERPEKINVKLYEAAEAHELSKWHYVTFEIYEGNQVVHSVTDVYKDGSSFAATVLIPYQWYCDCSQKTGNITVTEAAKNSGIAEYSVVSGQITEDCTFAVTVNRDRTDDITCTVTSKPLTNYDPGIDLESPTTRCVAEAELSSDNNWYHKFTECVLKNDKYYYIVEETPDGYAANYLVNGLKTGQLELMNNAVPNGSITVDKTWLNDNVPSGVNELNFTVAAFKAEAVQQQSDYAKKNVTKVELDVTFDSAGFERQKFKYVVSKGETYKLYIGGRVSYNNNYSNNTLTLLPSETTLPFNCTNENTGVSFAITVPADAEGSINAYIKNDWSGGLNTGYGNPQSDEFDIKLKDSSDNESVKYANDDDISGILYPVEPSAATIYKAATVIYPEGDPVLTKTLTLTKNAAGKWVGELKALPLTDGGDTLYYYIKEEYDPTAAYKPINYSKNGFTLTDGETESVGVINQAEKQSSYSLPESGGEGTAGYLITGGALMLGAALYYILRKRKAAA